MIMNQLGEYQEPLKSGGKLIITPANWRIEYYFLGPDLRYNGHSVSIYSDKVDDYIKAYETNFKKFEELLTTIPKDGSFEMTGECGMSICIRGYRHGVNISYGRSTTFPITNREKLQEVINDYEYSKKRAAEITKVLYNR